MIVEGGGGSTSKKQKVVHGSRFTPSRSGSRSTSSSGSYRSAPVAPASSYSPPTTYGAKAPSYNPAPKSFSSAMGGGGHKSKPKSPPPPPSIKEYLGTDEQYQRDRASLLKNFRNLRATNKENRGNVREDKSTTLDRLGREKTQNYQDMVDDFAARGLYGGAEFLNKKNEFDLDYLNQRSDTRQSASRNIQQLLRDLHGGKTLRNENMSQARLEAIRRRAAKYGIKE